MDISRCRQELKDLLAKQEKEVDAILGVRGLIKGGIYKTKTKCGKKGCRCAKGELHTIWVLYRSENGKTETRSIKEEDVYEYGHYTDDYQKYRQARAALVKLHRKQLMLVDLIEEGLRKEKRGIEQKLFVKGR